MTTLHSGMQRVIGYLLRDQAVEDCATGEVVTVSLPVSKATIASRLSLTPEYFSRVLHELEAAGLVRIDKRDVHILDVQRLDRPAHVPVLGEQAGAALWRVRRLRYLSQVPVALEEIWFQAEHLQALTAQELGDSMYLFYQQRFGLWIARVEDRLSAALAPDWASPPSALKAGDCAGFIERLSWTAGNVLAEYSQTWFDPAVCRYSSRLSQ